MQTARGTPTNNSSTHTARSTFSAVSATDRPVVAKFYGAYNIGQNTQIGAFVYAGSGTPMTTYVKTVHNTDLFVEGRGDMGRTPFYNKTDLLVSHELPMGQQQDAVRAERVEPLQSEDGDGIFSTPESWSGRA